MKRCEHPLAANGRHRWAFVRNQTEATLSFHTRSNGGGARLSLRGVYRCQCGAVKSGPHRHEEPAT